MTLLISHNEAGNQPAIVNGLRRQFNDEVRIVPLDTGDFAAVDTPLSLGIERKSFPNLVSSMMNHELDDQLTRLVDTYDVPVLLVEGLPTHPDRNGKVRIWGANKAVPFSWVMQTVADHCARGVILWQVEAKKNTAGAVAEWYRWAAKGEHREHYRPKRVLPPLRRYSFAQEVALTSFPGVGEVAVRKLGGVSLREMAGWSEEDWQGVLGKAKGSEVWKRWGAR